MTDPTPREIIAAVGAFENFTADDGLPGVRLRYGPDLAAAVLAALHDAGIVLARYVHDLNDPCICDGSGMVDIDHVPGDPYSGFTVGPCPGALVEIPAT